MEILGLVKNQKRRILKIFFEKMEKMNHEVTDFWWQCREKILARSDVGQIF